jgi:negative regulator of sigma E activity
MAEPQHHALSDLLDGELDADQADAAIDVLLRDPAMADEWRRMHQLRGLLRGEVDAPFDVGSAVHAAIANEPAFLLPAIARPPQRRSWQRYVVGGALAASVALATVVGIRPWQAKATGPATQVATTAAKPAVELATVADVAEPGRQIPPTRRLDSYWAVHADSALLAGPESLSTLVHNVSIDRPQ